MSSIDELLAAAEADVTRGWLPACQVAVARDGKLAAFATFGDATDDTRFAVFSATKPIVAAAAWVLMGEGLLDVARPVADYVPEFATHGKHAVAMRWPASPRRSTSDGAPGPVCDAGHRRGSAALSYAGVRAWSRRRRDDGWICER
jgi:CubicO group peptidase (beta-lactamase class C family)